MKLNFICIWEKNREKTWSGTTFSLYKSLVKKNLVYDLSIKYSFLENLLIKLSKISINKGKINSSNQFPKFLDILNQLKLNSLVKNENPTIQIGCFGYTRNSYIYEDMSVSVLLDLISDNNEAFKYSNFKKSSIETIKKRALRQLKIYEKNKAILTMSKWVANNLEQKLYNTRVYHVGAGINIDKTAIDYSLKKKNKFLFVGRDFYRKGGDLVVNAFLQLSSKLPGLELYIAGPKKQLIDTPENVFWVGDIEKKELQYYFNICDIFCMPSRFEAYGIVFSEALCYGLPCIGRDDFEMPYIIEEKITGRLLKNSNINELEELMRDVISDSKYFENVIKRKEFYLNYYSWDTVATRIESVIRNIES